MLRRLTAMLCLSFTVSLGSAGTDKKPKHVQCQELLDEAIQLAKATTDELNRIKDVPTAKAGTAALKKNAKQLHDIPDKLKKIGPLTKEDLGRLSLQGLVEVREPHTQALQRLLEFLKGKSLPKAANDSLAAALSEWSAANLSVSKAFAAIEPK